MSFCDEDEEINNGQGYPGANSSSSEEEEESFILYGHRWTRKTLDAYYKEQEGKSHTWSRNSY